jgi:hypothetical protein
MRHAAAYKSDSKPSVQLVTRKSEINVCVACLSRCPGGGRAMALHNRDRSSAFLAANSSDERMPFFCKSARRSILSKMSVSWAVAACEGWACGAGAGAGALRGTPSTDTTGNVETLMVPCW